MAIFYFYCCSCPMFSGLLSLMLSKLDDICKVQANVGINLSSCWKITLNAILVPILLLCLFMFSFLKMLFFCSEALK